MPSKTSLFLIGSLAINAALLGIFGGQLLHSKDPTGKGEPTVQMQLDRYGPTADVVRDAWAKLPDEDRAILRKELRDSWVAMEGERQHLAEAGKKVFNAALSDPFKEVELRDAVTIFQQRERALQQAAEDIFISHLGKMPPEARATAAVGLLTPFNARMQRSGEGKGPGVQGKVDGKPGVLKPTPDKLAPKPN